MKKIFSPKLVFYTITISLLILPSTQFSKPQKNKQCKNGNKLQTRLAKQHHKIQRRSDPETAQLNAFLKSLKKNPVNQITSSAQDVIFVNNFENKKEQEVARQNLIETIEKYKCKSSRILENIAPILKVIGGIEIAKKILGKVKAYQKDCHCQGAWGPFVRNCICRGDDCCNGNGYCDIDSEECMDYPYQTLQENNCRGNMLQLMDDSWEKNEKNCPFVILTVFDVQSNKTLPVFDINNLPGSETSQNSCPVVKSNNTFSIINTILIVGAITGYFGRKAVRKYGPKILNKSKKTYRQCFCSKPEINDLFKKEGNQNESTSSTESSTSDKTSESESHTSNETSESESETSTTE